MDEADFLCDRVAVIDYGKVIALDSPHNLIKSVFKSALKISFTPDQEFDLTQFAAFFTFVFPVFFLFLTMEVFIGRPVIEVPTATGMMEIRIINYVLPNLMLMIVAITAFVSLPIITVEYRQTRFFKRLRANPVSSSTILAALGIVYFIITFCGIMLLALVAFTIYGANIEGNIFLFILSLAFSYLAIAAIGFGLLGSLLRSSRSAVAIGQIIYFPAMFFSGVFVPIDQLPEWLRPISEFIPITHAARLMQGMWQGEPVGDFPKEIAVLTGVILLCIFVAIKKFRWE